MSEERLQEIKDSVDFQKQILMAHNMETLCVDEEQELIEEIERLNNIIVKLKKVLWQRCEEAKKNEQYVRLNCYKDILNELVNTIYEAGDETNE